MTNRMLLWLGTLMMLAAPSTRATAQDCYESTIVSPTPFMGNNGEIFKLADGTVWEVKYEYLYEYSPSVVICPSRGKLIIGDNTLNVQLVAAAPGSGATDTGGSQGWNVFEETNLQGSISGTVKQGRIFKTTSGHIYEVTGLTLQLVLELQPEVLVLQRGGVYKLIVEGFDDSLICKCLNCGASTANSSSAPPLTAKEILKTVQIALAALGFNPGSANGVMNSRTKSAIKKFRVSAGLARTRNLDPATLRSIAAALTKKYPNNSDALAVASYLSQASNNWPPSGRGNRAPAPRIATSQVVESHITNDFDGLDYGNIYKLANGQVWEQTDAWIWVWIWVNPHVLIVNEGGIYRMKVEGIDHAVMVSRIR